MKAKMTKTERKKALDYLKAVSDAKFLPNFWMSEEYIQKAGLHYVEMFGMEGFQDVPGDWFFPPLFCSLPVLRGNIYSGFLTDKLRVCGKVASTFLDYQFIYQASDFDDLSGNKWKVFRKNIKKYERRVSGKLNYKPLEPGEQTQQVENLLLKWADGREVFDSEVFILFVMKGHNREALFVDDKLVGLNVFDQNFAFTNYRYCLDDGSPFLNELMRYLFYTNRGSATINDGGSLGLEGLYHFKHKLNPIQIYRVFSYGRRTQNEDK